MKQAAQKHSVLNDRIVTIPEDRILELKLEVFKTKSTVNRQFKRS